MAYQLEVVDLNSLPPAPEVLSEQELDFFNHLKIQKRKTEWLGGRLALKKLLCAQLGASWKDSQILAPGGVGKPTVTIGGQAVNIPFSLTHSNGFAVAAIAPDNKYIGIDLEKVSPRIGAWKNTFFHPSELVREDDVFLTTLWTQKEAVVKLLGSGLTINTLEVRIVNATAKLSGRALELYNTLGAPEIALQTSSLLPGFCFSVAIGN